MLKRCSVSVGVAVFSCSVCVGLSYDPPVPVLIGDKSKNGHCSTPVDAQDSPYSMMQSDYFVYVVLKY